MSAPLEQATQAVVEARRAVHESLIGLPAWAADTAREQLHQLEEAVRRHDAEKVRAMDPVEIALAGQDARDNIANQLDSDNEQP